jgi:hypothetical protein
LNAIPLIRNPVIQMRRQSAGQQEPQRCITLQRTF